MSTIMIKGFTGSWRKVSEEEALIFARQLYKASPFKGQRAIDEINKNHLRGVKIKLHHGEHSVDKNS